MPHFFWVILIPIVAIVGGCAVAIVGTMARARVREAEIRERIAMIERGLVPAPEVDPRGFDRAMRRYDRGPRRGKQRRVGVGLVGMGFGLMVLFSFAAGSAREGIGIGGFVAILGAAFFLSSFFDDPQPMAWDLPAVKTPTPAPLDAPPADRH